MDRTTEADKDGPAHFLRGKQRRQINPAGFGCTFSGHCRAKPDAADLPRGCGG